MANTSILNAFERMWQHTVTALSKKSDIGHGHTASDIGAAAASHNHAEVAISPAAIEMTPPSGSAFGGYIDFHYGGSSEDYTTRLIESESGTLQLIGKLSVTGGIDGAVTGGFGYGGKMTYIDLTSGTYSGMTLAAALDSVLGTMVSGSAAQVQINAPDSDFSYRCFGKLWRYGSTNGGNATLEVITYSGYKAILRRLSDRGWLTEWEWENPPMTAGKEYRTLERIDGKVVYTKLIYAGEMPDSGNKDVYLGDATTMPNYPFRQEVYSYDSDWYGDRKILSGGYWKSGDSKYFGIEPPSGKTVAGYHTYLRIWYYK